MNSKLIFACLLSITVCQDRDSFPDLTNTTFQDDCLNNNNYDRGLHQMTPALILNQSAVDYAKSRCSVVSQYEGLSNGHTGLVGYGENLYWGGSSSNVVSECSQAVRAWYAEIKYYNYSNPGYSSATGHFTQLVWKSTTDVGCARCGGKGTQWYETYIVCNYSPAGNIISPGYFEANVLPLKA